MIGSCDPARDVAQRSLWMRGDDQQTGYMFSYLSPEERVPADHPLRAVRRLTDAALTDLSGRFHTMYSDIGRPSIPPEQLLRALLLQFLYSIRSERLLIEQLNYNLLFRWFVGLSMDAAVWNHSTFSKNRDRLLAGDVAAEFLAAVVRHAAAAGLLSDEHFTVDGTLLEAWASQKSFRRKDAPPPDKPSGGNATVNFRGERRRNDTHQSTTDPDARLYKKTSGSPAQLGYLGHLLMENRSALVVDAIVTPATGTAERDAAVYLVSRRPGDHRLTLGADKAYDARAHIAELRQLGVTPHVAQWPDTDRRCSAIDGRTTRHPGYAISQRKRKQIEQSFGWLKTVALLRKVKHRGGARVDWIFTFAAAAYNLIRMPRLMARHA
jgi:transposase